MNKTKIEYLTHSWNPIKMKCTPVSAGCANCWHLAMAKRLAGNISLAEAERFAYNGDRFGVVGLPVLRDKELSAPLHLRKPARIGVQFMGDLFHDDVPRGFIDAIWSTMAEARRHTFYVLTKRPRRMFDFMKDRQNKGWKADWQNVWLGVSIEDQKTADERIPILLQIPAAHRWVSIEPMLGEINLCKMSEIEKGKGTSWVGPRGISWVVCGCESGPKRRSCKVEWIRDLKNQCVAAGVPFFLKQAPGYLNGKFGVYKMPELDGREWNEMPK